MLSPNDKKYILGNAYIPEHILNIMVLISKGEPFLIDSHLCISKDDWLMFVGYPLGQEFSMENLERVLREAIKRFQAEHIWFIAPEIPPSIIPLCQERESDYYYKLELSGLEIKKDLMRLVRRASGNLNIKKGREISEEHRGLIAEFLQREEPNPLIRELFLSMEEYVKESETSIVLNAFDKKGRLTAFYVVELWSPCFATYVVGAHSKKNYASGSSDILFFEMINLAKEHSKGYIHLGLGVNKGISRFKEKWGGVPFLRYEFCGYARKSNKTLKLLKLLKQKL